MITAPNCWNVDPGLATTATSQMIQAVVYTAVIVALQVKAASPMITAPTRRLSVTFAIAAAIAATVKTIVAIGGRHANKATATVVVVVTIADTTLVVPPLVARAIESSSSETATSAISSLRARVGKGWYPKNGVRR